LWHIHQLFVRFHDMLSIEVCHRKTESGVVERAI